MFFQLNSIIVDPDESNRAEMTQFLQAHGCAVVSAMATIEQLQSYLARNEKPQIVIVNLDPGASDTLRSLQPIIRTNGDVSFFTMSQVLDPHLLMDAMHAGVKEFIPLPIQEQKFRQALERLASASGSGSKGRVITVIPTIGGVGSTTIACNIAAALAQNSKTVLVDLDLMRGGVAGYFDIRPRYTIADVMQSGENIDRQVLDNALAVHPASGLSILARPEMPEDSQRVNPQSFNRLLAVLTRMFDNVILDSMMSIDPLYASALNSSIINLVTMQLNVPSAKNSERFVSMLRRMGIESSKIKVVVNRYVKKGWDIDPEEVEKALGLKISWMVPNDYKNAIAAMNYGEPVVIRAPRAEMSRSLLELTGMISETTLAMAA